VAVVAELAAVAGLHQRQAHRLCPALLRLPVARLRRHLQDKVEEGSGVLQLELAPEARRPSTLRAIGCLW
jgi:hypothetical protein